MRPGCCLGDPSFDTKLWKMDMLEGEEEEEGRSAFLHDELFRKVGVSDYMVINNHCLYKHIWFMI